jgi:hypothetical protein
MKVCSKCGIDKELTDFNKDCTASDGYSYLCKPCRKEYRKVCRANNPAMYERRKAKSREWWDKKRDGDPLFFAKHCFRNRQVVAKKLGIPFGIKFEDLPPVPEKCPVLGIAIAHCSGHDTAPSLDRIIPSYGYVQGNVAWISGRANRIKNDASLEELESVTRWLREQLREEGIVP